MKQLLLLSLCPLISACSGPKQMEQNHASAPDQTGLAAFEMRIPAPNRQVSTTAYVKKDDIIPIIYSYGSLSIRADGKSLHSAEPGEEIDVLNLASKATVTGNVSVDGVIYVGG